MNNQFNHYDFFFDYHFVVQSLRDWAEFKSNFALITPFSVDHLLNRIQTNILYFETNYLVVLICFFLFCSVFSASLAGFFGVVSGLGVILFVILDQKPITFVDTELTEEQKFILLISVGGIIIMTTDAYIQTVALFFIFAVFVVGHAVLKIPPDSFPPLPPTSISFSHRLGGARTGLSACKSAPEPSQSPLDPLALIANTKKQISTKAELLGANLNEFVSKASKDSPRALFKINSKEN